MQVKCSQVVGSNSRMLLLCLDLYVASRQLFVLATLRMCVSTLNTHLRYTIWHESSKLRTITALEVLEHPS